MQQCRKHLQRQVSPFDVAGLAAEKEELEKKMGAPDFWDDVEAANKANQRMKTISAKLEKYNRLRGLLEDAEVMADMAEEGDDQEIADELIKDMPNLESKVEALKLETLLKGPYDRLNAILSLHAGAGGTEAQDWVSILYRMYTRYCESKGWTVRELDYLAGDEAGIKSVTFEVEGDNAYGYLKAEKGVHRLVRISPFDAFGKRHTSFASLDVTPHIRGGHQRDRDQPRRYPHRHLPFRRRGRPERQQGKLGNTYNALPDRHSGAVPERAQPAPQ